MYDYSNEPRRVIFMIDSKSFYASVEAVHRNLDPLKAVLVVMSTAENTNGGLVLAASPMAKKLFGISNVSRARDVPTDDKRLIIAPPRMNAYIKENIKINNIFKQFTADEDIHSYSIDESLLDMTESWKLFGDNPYEVARKIQIKVKQETGIYLTVGIGDNPFLAKLAMDLEAKKNKSLIAQWHYEDVPDKLWTITDLESVWSIGRRTVAKLNKSGIHSMYDLAHRNPYEIKDKFGIIGSQLFAFSWGIDRAIIRNKFVTKGKSYGNSQVLPRDYSSRKEIEIVIREIAEQVAARLRSHHKLTTVVHLWIGFSLIERDHNLKSGFSHSLKITATNSNKELTNYVLNIFRTNWNGESIRHIGVSCGNLIQDNIQQLNMFDVNLNAIKQNNLDRTVDQIRKKYGFKSVVKLSSMDKGGTAINRAGLVGGHAGGNAYE